MLPVTGATEQYLTDLDRLSSQMTDVQRQLTSGYRVGSVADDPAAVTSILETQSRISQIQQSQKNLGNVQTELQSGDAALQQAMKAVETAISIASQSSSPLSNATQYTVLAQQVQGLQQTLVNLSATSADGRYIFSGDQDQQALYALDPTQPNGVAQLATATSTRSVTDSTGTQVWLSRTATDIFDARNPDGSSATGNVFAAVQSLLTALQNNDSAGALASISSLKAADDHLNQQLGYYGIGESRVTDAINTAAQSLNSEQQNLSGMRDTDMAAAALQLTQLGVQQQAALTSRAKISGVNLFDFLA